MHISEYSNINYADKRKAMLSWLISVLIEQTSPALCRIAYAPLR